MMGSKSITKAELAFRIASRFPGREPRAEELMCEFGISRSRAYEFKAAMRRAGVLEAGKQAFVFRVVL